MPKHEPQTSQTSPRQIIKGTEIVDDSWIYLGEDENAPAGAALLLSVERFLRDSKALRASGHRLGVRFETKHAGNELGDELASVELVAVDFPKFTDGRGYTVAQRLRNQLGWTGSLRAIGDVLPDQVFYLRRCGFDELDVRADKSIEDARSFLGTFSVVYQGDTVDPRPLYRRRA